MAEPTFLQVMQKGRQGKTVDESQYCLFCASLQDQVRIPRITGSTEQLVLEFSYGEGPQQGGVRLRQVGSNLVVEESGAGRFRAYLEKQQVKYVGHALMYAIHFKIEDLSGFIERGVEELKEMEDALDNCIDNSGTYEILDYRRKYTGYGNELIALEEILTRFNKGYYPMQMQNSYVLQGQTELEFRFLKERYELIKDTVIKDMDTYTSIINNNLNRNTRLLSIISLAGVVLNFFFGSLLSSHPLLGIIGGILIGGLSIAAALVYHRGERNPDGTSAIGKIMSRFSVQKRTKRESSRSSDGV